MVESSMVIRTAKPEDFDSIVPLLKQLWPANPLDLKAAREIFDRGLPNREDAGGWSWTRDFIALRPTGSMRSEASRSGHFCFPR